MDYYLPFTPEIPRTQDFGNPQNNAIVANGAPHGGDDYGTPVGTPVFAPGDGVIDFVGWFDDTYADNYAWNTNMGGLMLWWNGGDNAPSFEYGHLSIAFVVPGQKVRAGDIIALTGNSGGSTGPHCHVGCLPPQFTLNTPTYGRVNPRNYMTKHWDGGGNIVALSIDITATTITEQDDNEMMVLAKTPDSPQVWLGNGLIRRPVWTMDTKQNLDWLQSRGIIGPIFEDGVIQTIPDLNSIGLDLMALVGKGFEG